MGFTIPPFSLSSVCVLAQKTATEDGKVWKGWGEGERKSAFSCAHDLIWQTLLTMLNYYIAGLSLGPNLVVLVVWQPAAVQAANGTIWLKNPMLVCYLKNDITSEEGKSILTGKISSRSLFVNSELNPQSILFRPLSSPKPNTSLLSPSTQKTKKEWKK